MAQSDLNTGEDILTGVPQDAAQMGLREWRRMAEQRYWKGLFALLEENVVFRNPATSEVYRGGQPMNAILEAVFSIMQDFTYLRHFSSTGFALEFSARVDGELLY